MSGQVKQAVPVSPVPTSMHAARVKVGAVEMVGITLACPMGMLMVFLPDDAARVLRDELTASLSAIVLLPGVLS